MRYAAVIFDCDGVLVDSEILGLEDSAAYLRAHGLPWSGADLVRLFTGLRDDAFRRRLIDGYRKANMVDPPADFFDGLIDQRRRRRDELREVAGAADALRLTRGRNAVASSSRRAVLHDKLKRVGHYDLVAPNIYSGDDVAHGKPAPDLFLHAADRLGVAPRDCLVVEDSVNGVAAGVAAGMAVCAFLGGGHCFEGHRERLEEAGASFAAASFSDLVRVIG
ncbi:MAG: HAD family phosphatase [Parvularculaceae bacterium]|jgi:HAD superfamily hydrolase (TIGR01509 family)|nr:HAD family phosphatase [Parvularculaceae bacterium]